MIGPRLAAPEEPGRSVILFLHNRYRASGGEERAVHDLLWLVREHLGEDAELLERDSALLGRGHAAAGMLRGGLAPEEVARAVRRTGARIVHAHNLNPAFGWRALAAARDAGARVSPTCTSTGWSARSASASRRGGNAHAATGATRSRGSFIYVAAPPPSRSSTGARSPCGSAVSRR
jgi:hypothetical protein